MTKKQENNVKKLLLRLPKKTFMEVEKRAETMSRSVNGQIVYELNQK